MIGRLARSLSFRLLAIFLVMGALFVYSALLGIRWVYATDQVRELLSGHLKLHVEYVKNDIGNPPSIASALTITEKVPVDIRLAGPDVDWASDPRFPRVEDLQFGNGELTAGDPGSWLRDIDGVQFATHDSHTFLRLEQGSYSIIVSSPKIADEMVQRSLTAVIVGFGLIFMLLTYLGVRWLFRPIGAIRRGAAQIGRGNFNHRITDIRADQLGDLANDINQMADDVERMLDAKRQVLLGISHELRSPLSRMNLSMELAGDSGTLQGMRADVKEMESIIATLLEAERLNTRHAVLQVSRFPAGGLLDEIIGSFFADQMARIDTSVVPDDLQVNADRARLLLLLKNLIGNALRYTTAEDGPVEIRFETRGEAWRIQVRDHGPGIAEAQVEFIGEPFYRGDPSRTRQTGGSGLGLYLARLVAEAHGGTLELDRTWRDGACFVVTLPFEPGR